MEKSVTSFTEVQPSEYQSPHVKLHPSQKFHQVSRPIQHFSGQDRESCLLKIQCEPCETSVKA